MKSFLFSLSLILLISACGGEDGRDEKAALSALKKSLSDPDAAKIEDVHIVNREKREQGQEFIIVCGKLNAKTQANAYVGFREFHVNMLLSKDKVATILKIGVDGSPDYEKFWCEGGANSK